MPQGQDRFYKDRAWLHTTYWDEDFSVQDIADFCGVTRLTILKWMDKLGVSRRPPGRSSTTLANPAKPYTSREWLYDQYYTRQLTTQKIADSCEVCPLTIYNWMVKLDIPRRPPGQQAPSRPNPAKPYTDRKWLYQQYWTLSLSAQKIADSQKVSILTIYKWMNKLDVPRRPPGRPSTSGLLTATLITPEAITID